MDVILLFGQYILVKQQNDIHFIYIYNTKYTTKWKHAPALYDVAINSTMHTFILLNKF